MRSAIFWGIVGIFMVFAFAFSVIESALDEAKIREELQK